MCGIVGIVGSKPERRELEAMLRSIRHRGPDGEGIFISNGIALGSVRLAIVDPTPCGAQPMRSPDGRYTLAFNGELYDHLDFRPALEARGARFSGHSDTETLLWLLMLKGEDVLPKLHGIFGFAFHDAADNSVLLARDHMGVKPLYYARGKQRLLFGSEIKALLQTGEVEPRANLDDILELLMFHFVSGERTAFEDVRELLPGHSLRYADGRIRVRCFWSPLDTAFAGNGVNSAERLEELLAHSVRRQLMSDVPIGVMSSAGLDSSVITKFSADVKPLQGFCFRDPRFGYDEFKEARCFFEHYGAPIEEVRIADKEIPSLLEQLTWYYDEPIPRPHHLAAYAVSRQASMAGFKVLLSGEGGDELFGGYQRYLELEAEMRSSGDLSALVFAHNRVALPRVARFCSQKRFVNAFRFWCAEETTGLDLINRQLLVDQKTFLLHFLQRSDRMGMAAGLEVRAPLLDIPLVEYLNSLPGDAKVGRGNTKICLKIAARRFLPSAVVDRPKQPFDMPMVPLLERGEVAEFVNELLLSCPRSGDLFEPKEVQALLRDFYAGRTELWKIIWLLASFELWMRTFRVQV